jgi:hypothetical protein
MIKYLNNLRAQVEKQNTCVSMKVIDNTEKVWLLVKEWMVNNNKKIIEPDVCEGDSDNILLSWYSMDHTEVKHYLEVEVFSNGDLEVFARVYHHGRDDDYNTFYEEYKIDSFNVDALRSVLDFL